jgi:hypothetical protein
VLHWAWELVGLPCAAATAAAATAALHQRAGLCCVVLTRLALLAEHDSSTAAYRCPWLTSINQQAGQLWQFACESPSLIPPHM